MADKEKLTQALQAKKANFDEWYPEIIKKAELADYTKVSGCIVYRPYSYQMWEMLRNALDIGFKKLGVKNAYFPLLIPESLLKKEQEHVKGFNPEVAWVTHAGDSKLDERLAIRPTSETIMYDSYANWIKSWRDLPMKINQWNSVVRWEFKHPKPFLRGREFLWQEGHTVFSNQEEAEKECIDVLELYYQIVRDYMALEGTKSRKTDKEKFAGAVYSKSLEYMMPDGLMIQGPDTHFDGQMFSKAFDLKFLNKEGKIEFAWQNTWGFSTRMLGVMFAVHGDDKGLVIPPKIAPTQVVIVPIYKDQDRQKVLSEANKILEKISKEFRTYLDLREGYTPGWKFNEWELKGIPLRIEIGPKDIENSSVVFVRRDNGVKKSVKIIDIEKEIALELDDIQKTLYKNAKKFLDEHTKTAKSYDELKKFVDGNRVLAALCSDVKCEDQVKEDTGAKTTGIPIGNEHASGKCIVCGKDAKFKVYFAKCY